MATAPKNRSRARWSLAPVALAVLVSAGVLKSSSALSWVPIDLTLLSALVIVLSVGHTLLGTPLPSWPRPLPILLALPVAALGLLSFNGADYSGAKAVGLFTLTLGCGYLAALVLVQTQRQRSALAIGIIFTGLLVLLLATVASTAGSNDSGRLALSGDATIAPARTAGAAVVVLLAFAFVGRLSVLIVLPPVGLLLGLVVSTGARGPLAALMGAVLLSALVGRPRTRRLRADLSILIFAILGLVAVLTSAESVRKRLLLLLSEDMGASVNVRQGAYATAWKAMVDHPFGLGWGGLDPLLQDARYPHNLVLEVGAEAGLLAILVLLFGMAIAGRRLIRAARDGEAAAAALFALLVFWFLNSLVSGDINDNRGLFVALGAGLAMRPTAQRRGARSEATETVRSTRSARQPS